MNILSGTNNDPQLLEYLQDIFHSKTVTILDPFTVAETLADKLIDDIKKPEYEDNTKEALEKLKTKYYKDFDKVITEYKEAVKKVAPRVEEYKKELDQDLKDERARLERIYGANSDAVRTAMRTREALNANRFNQYKERQYGTERTRYGLKLGQLEAEAKKELDYVYESFLSSALRNLRHPYYYYQSFKKFYLANYRGVMAELRRLNHPYGGQ